MTESFDIIEKSIADIQQAMAEGTLTARGLVEVYITRINEIDKAGPKINSILTLNPNALKRAEALDEERAEKGPRSLLHGIPVILKHNYDTADMTTTAGSISLKDSIPLQDATAVKKLRDAGAIILGKGNMDEWAHGGSPGGGYSSLGGQTKNPYKLTRGPGGSSSGPAAAVAANLAVVGMGSDTLGSIRSPVSACGLVGIRPTMGLVGRGGIIPFSLTFDVIGPMTRNVADAAAVLSVIAGVDKRDPSTYAGIESVEGDYTNFLDKNGLNGARLGVVGEFFGANPDVDGAVKHAVQDMQKQGAIIVEPIHFPEDLYTVFDTIYSTVSDLDFKWHLKDYLATLRPGYPIKSLTDIIADAEKNKHPIHEKVMQRLQKAEARETFTDYYYTTTLKCGPAMIGRLVKQVMERHALDALVFPTSKCPAMPLPHVKDDGYVCGSAKDSSGLASLPGYPSISVPAGFTSDGLPISVSFLGLSFKEPQLIKMAYAYEQATHHRKPPAF